MALSVQSRVSKVVDMWGVWIFAVLLVVCAFCVFQFQPMAEFSSDVPSTMGSMREVLSEAEGLQAVGVLETFEDDLQKLLQQEGAVTKALTDVLGDDKPCEEKLKILERIIKERGEPTPLKPIIDRLKQLKEKFDKDKASAMQHAIDLKMYLYARTGKLEPERNGGIKGVKDENWVDVAVTAGGAGKWKLYATRDGNFGPLKGSAGTLPVDVTLQIAAKGSTLLQVQQAGKALCFHETPGNLRDLQWSFGGAPAAGVPAAPTGTPPCQSTIDSVECRVTHGVTLCKVKYGLKVASADKAATATKNAYAFLHTKRT